MEIKMSLNHKNRIKYAGYGRNVFKAYEDAADKITIQIGSAFLQEFTDTVSYLCIKGGKADAVLFCKCAVELRFKNLTENVFFEWQRKISDVAKISPRVCKVLLENNSTTTGSLDLAGWLDWVATGLRYGANSIDNMADYFSLSNQVSLSFFNEHSGTLMFTNIKEQLKLELKSLFDISPEIISNTVKFQSAAKQRSSFSDRFFLLPPTYLGSSKRALKTYQAAVFHMGAHLRYGKKSFEVGQLKPMQVAIVSIIEDARVEMLAGLELPGLNRLWTEFHDAPSSGINTAQRMFERLSRALIDPNFHTDDGWAEKGKRMFYQARDSWDDPRISRVIGNILGNELGQLRVQFNAKDYVPNPVYRDDNNGLWAFPEAPSEDMQAHDLNVDLVEARRPIRGNLKNSNKQEETSENENENYGIAKPSIVDENSGRLIVKLPEFDYLANKLRKDWVSILEYRNILGSSKYLDYIESEYSEVIQKSERLFRSLSLGSSRKLKKQAEGENLDLDASVDALISIRTKTAPEQNIFENRSKPSRSLAIHLLLDTSESTRALVPNSSKSILELEREAAAILLKSFKKTRDPFAITGFSSNGRHDVRIQTVKQFDEEFGISNEMSLAGLASGYSTRMGAALRYCGNSFKKILTDRKLILLVTDGEPSDIDVNDAKYLTFDTKRAVSELKNVQVDVFCVALGKQAGNHAEQIFGKSGCVSINNLSSLPAKLTNLYVKLTS